MKDVSCPSTCSKRWPSHALLNVLVEQPHASIFAEIVARAMRRPGCSSPPIPPPMPSDMAATIGSDRPDPVMARHAMS